LHQHADVLGLRIGGRFRALRTLAPRRHVLAHELADLAFELAARRMICGDLTGRRRCTHVFLSLTARPRHAFGIDEPRLRRCAPTDAGDWSTRLSPPP